MCQIIKMVYSGGGIVVEVSSTKELNNCVFKLFLFDFYTGRYKDEPLVEQTISPFFISQENGAYRFQYSIPSKSKVKCVITENGQVLAEKEKAMGDRHKIRITSESIDVGQLFKVYSEISVSKKLISYKSDKSNVRFNLPEDIEANVPLVFIIQDKKFKPKFEACKELAECFLIEG